MRRSPPSGFFWRYLPPLTINAILDALVAGRPDGGRYSLSSSAPASVGAWAVICRLVPELFEGEARRVVQAWRVNGVIVVVKDGRGRERTAVYNRPGTTRIVK